MWNAQVRPYAESFGLDQEFNSLGIVNTMNFLRLDASQGGTAIRIAVSKNSVLTYELNSGMEAVFTFSDKLPIDSDFRDSPREASCYFYNTTEENLILNGGYVIIDYIIPEIIAIDYPWAKVRVYTSSRTGDFIPSGKIDIFPHYISHPHGGRRGR